MAEKAEKAASSIQSSYRTKSYGYRCDITNEDEILNVCESILKKTSRIDGLINNAANNPSTDKINRKSRLENFSIKDWNDDFNVGVTGAFLCSRVFGKEMLKRKSGVIVNISSDLGLIAPNQNLYLNENLSEDKQNVKPVSYSVTKHAMIGLTKYLSTYWAKDGIRSNALCPGGVYTNQSDDFVFKINKLIPMSRMANPDDYKGAIQFLCSDASSYMNGATLVIDGGRTAW